MVLPIYGSIRPQNVIIRMNGSKNRVEKDKWVVSEQAAGKLQFLNYDISIESPITGKDLIGKRVFDPIRHRSIPIFPGSFVDPDNGTGIVMSVPAHAPYDYQALKDLKRDISQQQEFGLLDIDDVNPITIIQTNGKPEPNNNSSSLLQSTK